MLITPASASASPYLYLLKRQPSELGDGGVEYLASFSDPQFQLPEHSPFTLLRSYLKGWF